MCVFLLTFCINFMNPPVDAEDSGGIDFMAATCPAAPPRQPKANSLIDIKSARTTVECATFCALMSNCQTFSFSQSCELFSDSSGKYQR